MLNTSLIYLFPYVPDSSQIGSANPKLWQRLSILGKGLLTAASRRKRARRELACFLMVLPTVSHVLSPVHFSVSFSLSPSKDAVDATSLWDWGGQRSFLKEKCIELLETEKLLLSLAVPKQQIVGFGRVIYPCQVLMFSCGLLLSFLETAHQDRWTFGLRRYGHSCVHRRPLMWGTRVLLLWIDRLQKGQQSAHFTAGYQQPLFE